MINVEANAKHIITVLNDAGYEAYAVGGCVRDAILGASVNDTDICTSALPHQVSALFERVIPTGEKHGTVTVMYNDVAYEVTTFRTEGNYTDGRHPDSVAFSSSLADDVCRRDFTVNAMAADADGNLYDFHGGYTDLSNGIIRCVGDPYQRFNEDALRILRALRFASVLDFDIDPTTAAAAEALKEKLSCVSAERIFAELKKLLCGKGAVRILLTYSSVITFILPELSRCIGFEQHNPHHLYTVYEHTARAVGSVPPVAVLRLAALFHDCGKPHCFSMDERGVGHFYSHASVSLPLAEGALNRLRCDNATRERVLTLIRFHDRPVEAKAPSVRRLLNRIGIEASRELLLLKRADACAQAMTETKLEQLELISALLEGEIESCACFTLNDLAVNGRDLMALGYKGKQIGAQLNFLLDEVMAERLPNEKTELLAVSEKAFKNQP